MRTAEPIPATGNNGRRPVRRRVKTPTLLQMDAQEGGAAALGIVLGYYGRRVPLEELRLACGSARDGTTARHLVQAGEAYGLVAAGAQQPAAALPALPLPFIAVWNFDQFVVVEGFSDGTVFLNDPATGPRRIAAADFAAAYTGTVLTFAPGAAFQKGGHAPPVLTTVRRYLAGSTPGVVYVLLTSLALVLLGLIVPAFTRVFVDYYLVGGLRSWLPTVLGGLILTAGLVAAFTWLQQESLLRLQTKLALTLTSKFVWHVLRLPVGFFTQRYASEISSRVAVNDRVAELLSGDLATNLLNGVLVIFYVVIMVQYDAVLTAIAVAIAVLNVVALRTVARRRADQSRRLLHERGRLLATVFNGLLMIETLKAGSTESDFFTRWAGSQAKVLNAEQELGLSTQVLGAVPPFLLGINTAAVLVVGGLRVIDGQLTIGALIAFQVLLLGFLLPINGLVDLGQALQEVSGDMGRLDDVLHSPADPQVAPGPIATERAPATARLSGHVELRNVTFGYSRLEPPLISDLSLSLRPGARVALVGASGSGKTTVARLIGGLYAPWAGEILFDERPRSALPRTLITNSLAFVDQEVFLFEGTVKDNLTLWDSTIPETHILQAAKDALIHEEIATRPDSYDHVVEEGGRNFSGGERQRLEIARALVGNPTILVLDEATSALDPATERNIDDNLRRRGCTCLIIAHRLSTIRDCDEILVLEQGRVVQRGTHDTLRRQRGPYARLIKADEGSKAASYLEALT